MIQVMKRKSLGVVGRWIAIGVLVAGPMLAMPQATQARSSEPEREVVDARLEGYASNVTLNPSSAGLMWVTMIILGVLCCAGLFKDAKRSHLD
jgi:hypothetical protein